MKGFQKFLDFLLPPHCPICQKRIWNNCAVCGECFGKLHFISGSICQKCGRPLPYKETRLCANCLKKSPIYHRAMSVLKYNEASKALILPFKHSDNTELAPLLIQWMDRVGKEIILESDCLVPVPLHISRLFKRKYNQAALLAKGLAKIYHKDYEPSVLLRHKYTKTQGHMNSTGRKQNVKNAFKVQNAHKIKGKNILLIDDVLTTGATINECTKFLLKAGAKRVDILTLARVIKD